MDFIQYLGILKVQFLSCLNTHLIKWNELKEVTWEQQEQIVENTVESDLNRKFPIRSSYQLVFLKQLIEYFERNEIEIHDVIYESYCKLKSNSFEDEKLAYKHYIIPQCDVQIMLKESKSIVIEGTTGLCSWQASLALSNMLLNHPEIVNNKTVIELGAGTGLSSFTTLKCCIPKEVMITDGSVKVLDLLNLNLANNFEYLSEIRHAYNKYQKYKLKNKGCISTLYFPWEEADNLNLKNLISPDVILAADVIYDNINFAPLSKAIDCIFKFMKNKCVMYLAATVRNPETLKEFLDILGSKDYIVEVIMDKSDRTFFYWDSTIPIDIYCLRKFS